MEIDPRLNEITGDIIASAIEVHKTLGPGLLERIYVHAVAQELHGIGRKVSLEVAVPIVYKGEVLGKDYRADMIVDDRVVVEVKSVESLHPVHTSRLLSYLRLTGRRLGLLINFNVPALRDGVSRIANRHGR